MPADGTTELLELFSSGILEQALEERPVVISTGTVLAASRMFGETDRTKNAACDVAEWVVFFKGQK
jgi:hypothetical protein